MTSTIKKRLEDALEIGHKIENQLKQDKKKSLNRLSATSIRSLEVSKLMSTPSSDTDISYGSSLYYSCDAFPKGVTSDYQTDIPNDEDHDDGSYLQMVGEDDIEIGDENGIYSIAVHPQRDQVVCGLGSGIMHIYDSKNWNRIRKLRTDMVVSLPLLAVKYYPCITKDTLFTGGSSGQVKVWDLEKYSVVDSVEEPGNQIMSLDFTNDGSNFATVGKDRSVRVYDSGRLQLSRIYGGTDTLDMESIDNDFSIPGHSQQIFAVKYHPDDKNILISASWDHTLKVWDMRLGNAIRTIHGPFVCGDGLDVRHNSILTASWQAQRALQIWDYRMESLLKTLSFPSRDHKGQFLYCGRFWDDDHIVAGGSGTNDLKLINIHSNKVLGSVSGDGRPVQAVEVNSKDNKVLCGTTGNVMKTATIS